MRWLAAMTEHGWDWFAAGDDDPLDWTITALYFVAVVASLLAFRRDRLAGERRRWVWVLAAAVALVLGVNKQLDAQVLLQQAVRRALDGSAASENKKLVGAAVIALGTLVAVATFAELLRRLRGGTRYHHAALVALAWLAAFVAVRAGGFIGALERLNRNHTAFVHATLELAPIVLLILAAVATARRPHASPRSG